MITGSLASACRMRRSVSRPFMAPMRTSMMTRSGLNFASSFKPSSPLEAVASSISGESKIRRKEYCTSASSSINNSLSITLSDGDRITVSAPIALKFFRLRDSTPRECPTWWRRCCGTAVRRGSGAPTGSKSGHYRRRAWLALKSFSSARFSEDGSHPRKSGSANSRRRRRAP